MPVRVGEQFTSEARDAGIQCGVTAPHICYFAGIGIADLE
jgi:hypothetical protein